MTESTPKASPKAHRARLIAGGVIVAGVIAYGCIAGVVLTVVQHARERAQRLECVNNLKQIGIAAHCYHDTNNDLPTEHGDERGFYTSLTPFFGCQTMQTVGPIKHYLCPSRRTTTVAPGKRDYGFAASQPPATFSILDSSPPVTLGALALRGSDYSATTLLLSHVWMAPSTYAGGDPTDLGWDTKNNARAINTTAKQDSDPTGSIHHIGGPHPRVLPSLFVDGHVGLIPYEYANWAQAWDWHNTQPFPLP